MCMSSVLIGYGAMIRLLSTCVCTYTVSPQVPYNIERLMLLFSDFNTELVKTMMSEFEANGRVQMDANVLKAMQKVVVGMFLKTSDKYER